MSLDEPFCRYLYSLQTVVNLKIDLEIAGHILRNQKCGYLQ